MGSLHAVSACIQQQGHAVTFAFPLHSHCAQSEHKLPYRYSHWVLTATVLNVSLLSASLLTVSLLTATVLRLSLFACCSTPTFPVDTHIYRLAQRWGLTQGKSVEQAEADLKVLLPEDKWNNLHLRFIYFGREHCPAQRHDPVACPICSWAAVPPHDKYSYSLSICPHVHFACGCTCVLSALSCLLFASTAHASAMLCAVPGIYVKCVEFGYLRIGLAGLASCNAVGWPVRSQLVCASVLCA